MSRLRACALGLILGATLPACVSVPLEERAWVGVDTGSFHVISSLSVEETVELARQLELFRVVMQRLTNAGEVSTPVPTRVYAFGSPGDFRQFQDDRNTGGFFMARMRANYVALVKTGTPLAPETILYHEYVHFVLHNHPHQHFPRWYDEGFAEYMAAVDIGDELVILGAPARHRVPALVFGDWIPMHRILSGEALTEGGPVAQEMFYTQAWLLVHYLHAERENLPEELDRYLRAINQGAPSERAFEDVFGMSSFDLARALRGYIRGGRVPALQLPRDMFPEPPVPRHRMLSRAEATHRLGVLALQARKTQLAQHLFEVAVASDPTYSRAHAGLGDALKFQGHWDESERHFERAVELGPGEFENHLDYGEYLQDRAMFVAQPGEERGDLLARARRAYVRSYQLNPDDPETYTMYGSTFLQEGHDVERALETLEHAHYLLPANLDIRFRLAQLYVALERADDARPLLESIIVWSHAPGQRAGAEKLLAELEAAASP